MTPEHQQLVQDTWEQVAPIADTAAEMFYGRLFELDPTLRQLFASTDMRAQGKKLMQMLAVAVKGLDKLDQLGPRCGEFRTPPRALWRQRRLLRYRRRGPALDARTWIGRSIHTCCPRRVDRNLYGVGHGHATCGRDHGVGHFV